ncbi:MAG: GNAT family N-acetyltransferase [Defluviitaleaceae bacterium]|nr:GNAT family N-acetyltransferase [Defluviitaleaceae bacterium]
MSDKLSIITMTADHIQEVDAMEQEVFGETAAPLEFLIDDFNDPNATLYVAYWGNELAGHGAMSRKSDDSADYCNIGNLMVKSGFRQKGIGKQLLATMLDTAKAQGLNKATLKVETENTGAINLYKSFGFQVEARLENFYADEGGHAYVMCKHHL